MASATDDDAQHLRLLSIFHYIVGGMMGLFGCFPIIHFVVGIAALSGAMNNGNGPPAAFGWIFITVAVAVMTFMWSVAIAIILAGPKLRDRTGYTYCVVAHVVERTFMPFGTVLGVLTLIVLMRPSVKAAFGVSAT
ncbi:MAG: hypothetical protein DWQ29_21190 [Planctomycetota bacterium]|nr:MAG: hypothetical protein DWQ29_21190 [Planctomycetota bacterium]